MKRYFSFLILIFFVGAQCLGPTLSLLSANGDENQTVFLDLENENEGEEEWEKLFSENLITSHFLQISSNITPFPSLALLYSSISTNQHYPPPEA